VTTDSRKIDGRLLSKTTRKRKMRRPAAFWTMPQVNWSRNQIELFKHLIILHHPPFFPVFPAHLMDTPSRNGISISREGDARNTFLTGDPKKTLKAGNCDRRVAGGTRIFCHYSDNTLTKKQRYVII
jgi:hypothetical protein